MVSRRENRRLLCHCRSNAACPVARLARDGEKNVTELLEPFAISQPAVSKHLRILREARLVRSRKVGRIRVYAVEASKLREVHDWVTHFEKYWDEKLDALGRYLDKRKRKKDK